MFDPSDYLISSELFLRLLGVIYFFVYVAFVFQMQGLFGKEGILPIAGYLELVKRSRGDKAYFLIPNIFWLKASDSFLVSSAVAGVALSILLIFGIFPATMILLLFILHLSIVNAGQDFLSFGWEMFLLEISFNSIFLALTDVPNIWIWISLYLLLFRFHLQGGAVKLQSRDPNWRNLTALAYHYQTQPIPNTIAWYAHKLPLWFQKFSTGLMFFIEIVVPFGIFLNLPQVNLALFFAFVGLQFFIWLTGNFSYLNYMTVVLSVILISDRYLAPFFGMPQEVHTTPLYLDLPLSIVGMALVAMQLMWLWNHFFTPNPLFTDVLRYVQRFHIANRYGIFAVMTTKRYEIVIEGSNDGKEWKEYTFYFKPSEVSRRPRRISPLQPRLDWQVWFLPFHRFGEENWFKSFLYRLLTGSPHVLALLRGNPFPDKPPKYLRVLFYDYVFSDPATKKMHGHWWKRQLIGYYATPMSLKENT